MWSCKAAAFECKSGTSTVSRACFVRHAVDGPNEINANLQHLQCNRAPQCLRHPHFAERFCCSLDNSRAHVLGEVSGRYTCLARHRRHQMKTRSAPLCRFLDTWRKALVAWLSNGTDTAVLDLRVLLLDAFCAQSYLAPALLKVSVLDATAAALVAQLTAVQESSTEGDCEVMCFLGTSPWTCDL